MICCSARKASWIKLRITKNSCTLKKKKPQISHLFSLNKEFCHPPALGVWVESTHFTPQYSFSHAIFKYCHLSFVPICISVMCTCEEPQAWTGSQTSPSEIIPVLGRSCVFGHSPQDRLTLLTEFRWARCWKSLHLSRLFPPVWAGKLALRLPPQISQAAAIHCQKVTTQDFSDKQMTSVTCENESLRGYSVSTVYRMEIGSELCDFQLLGSVHRASNQAHWPFCQYHKIFIAAECITGCIPYSHSFFMRNNQFLCRTMTNAVFYLMWYEFKSSFSLSIYRGEVDNSPSHL